MLFNCSIYNKSLILNTHQSIWRVCPVYSAYLSCLPHNKFRNSPPSRTSNYLNTIPILSARKLVPVPPYIALSWSERTRSEDSWKAPTCTRHHYMARGPAMWDMDFHVPSCLFPGLPGWHDRHHIHNNKLNTGFVGYSRYVYVQGRTWFLTQYG